jgi:hypothetical protein
MPTVEIRNMTPDGIHRGELKTMAVGSGPGFIIPISARIRKLYDQGFFAQRGTPTPRSITIAEVIIRSQALKIVYRKTAKGALSCTSHTIASLSTL